jgi:hypothetical protein
MTLAFWCQRFIMKANSNEVHKNATDVDIVSPIDWFS